MNEDIKRALNLLNCKCRVDKMVFLEYDSVYSLATENIKGYMPSLIDKKVLTVTSSGDHYFNAIVNGATEIDCFDLNVLTKYMVPLKKAAIELLDMEQFFCFFGLNTKYINFALDYSLFSIIKENLDKDILEYWETLYKSVSNNGKILSKSNLFYTSIMGSNFKNEFSLYLDETSYRLLRDKLKKIDKINFIWSDLLNLKDKLDKNYDVMFLSNISDYQINLRNFLDIVGDLGDNLNQFGQIYYAYLYIYHSNKNNGLLKDIVTNLNAKGNYTSKVIPGFYEIVDKIEYNEDKVLIYNKF